MAPDAPADRTPPAFERYDKAGRRLSMTAEEMRALLAAADDAPETWRTLCRLLAFTGCRPIEALSLSAADIDLRRRSISFRTIRRREHKEGVRAVPIPDLLLVDLARVHGIRAAQAAEDGGRQHPLWAWSQVTAWNRIGRLMEIAGIEPGPHANPRGMRHGFATLGIACGIPISLLQAWLGYVSAAKMRRAYPQARHRHPYQKIGRRKQRDLASRIWDVLISSPDREDCP
jgi:integrase